MELPLDHPRPKVQSFRGAFETFDLSQQFVEELRELSRRERVTLFMLLLTSFQILLMRYSGQQDIIVGSPVANRMSVETEGLIGCFVNMLVLRADLAGDPPFQKFLQRVRKMTLDAYDHQALPFERLVEELRLERFLSHNPLFQIVFELRNMPVQSLKLEGLTSHPVERKSKTAKFDLSLSLYTNKAGIQGTLEYNSDIFECITIRRLIDHWKILLRGIIANPEQRLSQIPLLTEEEKQQLTEMGYSKPSSTDLVLIPRLFEEQAQRTPDAIAVVYEDRHLTYGVLNKYANQLAHYLHRLGIGPEVVVGSCMERTPELVVGLLSILKVGGVYLPLDPASPKKRLSFMLEDAQARTLLTQQHLTEKLTFHGTVVCLDAEEQLFTHERDDNPDIQVMPNNLAYVIYTSGSTGEPKGVMIEHRGLLNLVSWHLQTFAINS